MDDPDRMDPDREWASGQVVDSQDQVALAGTVPAWVRAGIGPAGMVPAAFHPAAAVPVGTPMVVVPEDNRPLAVVPAGTVPVAVVVLAGTARVAVVVPPGTAREAVVAPESTGPVAALPAGAAPAAGRFRIALTAAVVSAAFVHSSRSPAALRALTFDRPRDQS